MLKQEIVYKKVSSSLSKEDKEWYRIADLIPSETTLKRCEGYFLTKEEMKKLLEDTYFEGECWGTGTDAATSKQDYINELLNE